MARPLWYRQLRQHLAPFRPRVVDSLSGYSRQHFAKDIGAGITVGLVALPLAMAFAIASGATPQAGLTAAIVGGLLVSLLGGSRVQIGGPAGAFIVVVYGIIERFGFSGLLIATAGAGVMLFLMGLFRLGRLIRFVPVSIIIGFTNGIAVLVIVSQIKAALGLSIDKVPADFFSQLVAIGQKLHTINLWAVGLCAASLALIIVWPKLYTGGAHPTLWRIVARLPGTILAIVLAAALTHSFALPVQTIGSHFGSIPQMLPQPIWPEFSWSQAQQLFAPAITLALLCAIESLLCARVADAATDERHDPNQELMAQGIANTCVPFFGGLPVTGTIARTMTNIKSGATSPISGVVHALTVLAIVLFAAPLADHIPLAALAAVLLFTGWNMGHWREFILLKNFSPTYRITLLSTFLLTVILDLTVAVEVGLVLSSLFFIVRISSLTRIESMDIPEAARTQVAGYRLYGSLFFGSVHRIESLSEAATIARLPNTLILDLTALLSLDSTGIDALDTLRRALHKRGRTLLISGAGGQPLSILKRSGFAHRLGAHNLYPDFSSALNRVHEAQTTPEQAS